MDKCFICNEQAVGQVEFDTPKGNHYKYPFCKNHYCVPDIYFAGYDEGYTECLEEAKKILNEKNILIHSLLRETKNEKQLLDRINNIRWDLHELKNKLDRD